MEETDKKTYKAKLAEQVERYDGKASRWGIRVDSGL